MEALNQPFGYVLYKTNLGQKQAIEDFRLIQCTDRAHVYVNGNHLFTKGDLEMEGKEAFELTSRKMSFRFW